MGCNFKSFSCAWNIFWYTGDKDVSAAIGSTVTLRGIPFPDAQAMGDGDMSVVDSYLEPVDGISGQYIVALGGLVSVRFGDNSMGFNQGATVTEFIPAPVQANKSV